MTNICLVRHGETDWNVLGKIQGKTDIPLNDTGVKQAQQCRDYLRDSHWDVVVTSPLQRAKKTAMIINEALQLPLVEMEEFMERSFGDAEGKTREERELLYPDMNYPNQEPREKLVERLMTGLGKILLAYPEQNVLLVAHGAVIHTLLNTMATDLITLDNTYLMNACISNIHFKDKQWHVKDFNLTQHLL